MCCCDGLLLIAHIEAEKARQAGTTCQAEGPASEVSSYHEFESTSAAKGPIERDHSLIHTALALCARLCKSGAGRPVSEAPLR